MAHGQTGSGRTYVLVHGAWHGGWVWKDVATILRAAGHVVTTGSLNTPVRLDVPARIEATIEGLGSASLQLARPGQESLA